MLGNASMAPSSVSRGTTVADSRTGRVGYHRPMVSEDVEGDLLDQQVDAIVNPWNRNVIPWWLLIPQGVSGALDRRAGDGALARGREVGADPAG